MFRPSPLFYERALLAPRNDVVDDLNHRLLLTMPGALMELLSADTPETTDQGNPVDYPPEYLHSLNIPGIPLHRLSLK